MTRRVTQYWHQRLDCKYVAVVLLFINSFYLCHVVIYLFKSFVFTYLFKSFYLYVVFTYSRLFLLFYTSSLNRCFLKLPMYGKSLTCSIIHVSLNPINLLFINVKHQTPHSVLDFCIGSVTTFFFLYVNLCFILRSSINFSNHIFNWIGAT